jgi:hypothetical protein
MRRWAAITLSALALAGAVLSAHDLGRSESVVVVNGQRARVRLIFDLLELSGVDANGDGEVSYRELDASIDRVYAAVKQHLVVTSDGTTARTTLERYAVRDSHVADLDLLLTFSAPVSQLTIRSTLHEILLPAHEHVTSVSFDGTPTTTLLDAATPEKTFTAPRRWPVSRRVAANAAAVLVGGALLYVLLKRPRAMR